MGCVDRVKCKKEWNQLLNGDELVIVLGVVVVK